MLLIIASINFGRLNKIRVKSKMSRKHTRPKKWSGARRPAGPATTALQRKNTVNSFQSQVITSKPWYFIYHIYPVFTDLIYTCRIESRLLDGEGAFKVKSLHQNHCTLYTIFILYLRTQFTHVESRAGYQTEGALTKSSHYIKTMVLYISYLSCIFEQILLPFVYWTPLKTYAAISNAHLSRVCKRGKLSGSCLSTLNGFGSTQLPIFLCHIGVPTFSSQNN